MTQERQWSVQLGTPCRRRLLCPFPLLFRLPGVLSPVWPQAPSLCEQRHGHERRQAPVRAAWCLADPAGHANRLADHTVCTVHWTCGEQGVSYEAGRKREEP